MNGIGALRKEVPQIPSSLSPREDTGRNLQPHLAMLAPPSWISSLQNCEKQVSGVYQPPDRWYFVTAS